MEIIRTTSFARRARKLMTDAELKTAEDEIAAAPEAWPVISGTGGVRKARAARGASGKSGGARIIYYYMAEGEQIYMLDIYAKNEQENITDASKKVLRETVKILKGEA
jgi:hypothetical protein